MHHSPRHNEGRDDDTEIERLARLPALEYDRQRIKAAEALGVRAPILDKLVAGARVKLGLIDQDDDKQGRAVSFPEPELWPEAVNGAELLDAMAAAIRRHVVLGDTARDAAALWVVHTYLVDRFSISPRLGVLSPTKRCGKTTLLDVLGSLVLRSLPTANVSPAAVFRVIEMYHPTLLVDEADTFIGTVTSCGGAEFRTSQRRPSAAHGRRGS
jgi:putative DNA primase/helicase